MFCKSSFIYQLKKNVYRLFINLFYDDFILTLKIFPQSIASAEAKYANDMSLEIRKNTFPKKSLQKTNTNYSGYKIILRYFLFFICLLETEH